MPSSALIKKVALLAGQPNLSIDVFTYIAQGRHASTGTNPYAHPVKEIAATPFGSELEARGWIPVHGVSPYGPLWTQFEAAVGRIATGIPGQVLSIKLLVVAFSVGSAAMIWLILGIVAPRSQLAGTLIYLWNPVVIVELAGEGHNDAAMLFFVLLSLW